MENDEMGRVDLAQIAADAVDLYAPAAEDAGHELRLDVTAAIVVRGNRHLLAQALSNLIDNAIKFSPAGGAIEVAVRNGEDGPELRVADQGPGIPADKHGYVIERFTRLDAARERPGSGLGLSLVAAVTELHGAALRFFDNAPGLAAVIVFPGIAP